MKTNKDKIEELHYIIKTIKSVNKNARKRGAEPYDMFFLCNDTDLNESDFNDYKLKDALYSLGGIHTYAFSKSGLGPSDPIEYNKWKIEILEKAIKLLENE